MKKAFLLAMIMLFAFGTTFAQKEVIYKLDVKKSAINWKANKLGGSHEGTINFKSGQLIMKNNVLVSGTFVVDMNSIQDTDLVDKAMNQKLVNHLKSEDFFNVKQFPEATFTITRADKKLNQDYFIIGKLTIKGKSQELRTPAVLDLRGDLLQTTVFTAFDRSKFDVRYGSKSFFANIGDKIIYDDVDLDIFIVAEK